MKYIRLEKIQKIETEILNEIHEICKAESIPYYLLCGSVLGAVRHDGPIPWDSDADIGVMVDDLDRLIDVLQKTLSKKFYVSFYSLDKKCPSMHPEIMARGIDGRILHVDIFPIFGMPDNEEEQKEHWNDILKCMKDLHSKRFAFIGNRDDLSLKTNIKRLIHYSKCALKWLFLDSSETIISRYEILLKKYSLNDCTFVTFPCAGNTSRAITKKDYFGKGMEHKYDGKVFIIPEHYQQYLNQLYGDYMVPTPIEKREKINGARIFPKEYKQYWE